MKWPIEAHESVLSFGLKEKLMVRLVGTIVWKTSWVYRKKGLDSLVFYVNAVNSLLKETLNSN